MFIEIQCFGPSDCSSQGICDVSTGTCTCDPGFLGVICQGNKPIFHIKPKPRVTFRMIGAPKFIMSWLCAHYEPLTFLDTSFLSGITEIICNVDNFITKSEKLLTPKLTQRKMNGK